MKKTSTEKTIKYYIKLAKKESKRRKLYIQRKNDTIFFSNGAFIVSFSAVRKDMLNFLQETFDFVAGEEDFCVEVLNDYCKNSEITISRYMPTTLEDGTLFYTGVNAEETRRTIYAFSDNVNLFAYDEKYVKPIKWGMFGKAHLPNSIYTMCVYIEMDLQIVVFPIVKHNSQFVKIAKLLNK